jgi:membrane-associated phospholipid phosphatase
VARRGGALVLLALALFAGAAILPSSGPLDAWFDRVLDGWRTCAGLALADRVSRLVKPVGVALLGLAVVRALWRRRPAALEVGWILAAAGAGVLLVGALKDVLDRPRPGAEFLLPGGGSFPSGHVGNTAVNGLAILTLWWGGARAGSRWSGWLVLATVLAIVAAARVYERRHWASDTFGAVAIAGGYGLLALRHPDPRWRVTATLAAVTAAILLRGGASWGYKLPLPAGTAASRGRFERVAFGTAYERGWLRGDWAPAAPDPQRRSAWLKSDAGGVVLPVRDDGVDEVRLVVRPRNDLPPTACMRLQVTLNGRLLGDPILQAGWRAYVFPTAPQDFGRGENVLALRIGGDAPHARDRPGRRAAFSELTLHVAAP